MSRRQDREGVRRSAYQGHVNAKFRASHVENDRGWRIPNTVEEGFEALTLSCWWLHYRCLWFATGVLTAQSEYERREALHSARSYLERAKTCPPAPLPC